MIIEEIMVKYLGDSLDVPVYAEMPNNMPEEFIIIERTSGTDEDKIESATIAIQSYSTSLLKAAELNKRLNEVMKDIVWLNEISSCKLNNSYNYTDTTRKLYRYQAVYDLVFFS